MEASDVISTREARVHKADCSCCGKCQHVRWVLQKRGIAFYDFLQRFKDVLLYQAYPAVLVEGKR